jgi:hypothetical protein
MTIRIKLTQGLVCFSLLALAACGSSSSSPDGGKKDARPDALGAADGRGDAVGDAGPEASADSTVTAPDAAADVATDSRPPDAAADASPDAAPDMASPDAATPDARMVDAPTPDAPPADAAADVAPDMATTDASPEAAAEPDARFSVDVRDEDIAVEAETLDNTPNGGATAENLDDPLTSAGAFTFYHGAKVGDSIDFALPNVPAGTYEVSMEWKGNNNRGIMTLLVDGTQVGPALDQFSDDASYETTTFGMVTFAADGNHTIRLLVTGKNAMNAGPTDFTLAADRFVLIKQ